MDDAPVDIALPFVFSDAGEATAFVGNVPGCSVSGIGKEVGLGRSICGGLTVESEVSSKRAGRSGGVTGGTVDEAEVDECVRVACAVEKSPIVRVGTRVWSSGFEEISTRPPTIPNAISVS